jgi:hypothetical protein
MQAQTETLIVALMGICGTVGGVVVGHLLGRSWQHKQWLMDQRNDEFRELVTALDDSMRSVAFTDHQKFDLTNEERRDTARKTTDFFRLCRTRIFTAADVRMLRVENTWREAVERFHSGGDFHMFNRKYDLLMDDLRIAAMNKRFKK